MKTLYLVRHAKSSWDSPTLRDFDRPLSERGKTDAPRMGQRLHKRGVAPELILSSPARRARSTARKIAREINYDLYQIQFADNLYHATPDTILQILSRLPDSFQSVMVVGHNPELTDFVNEYMGVRIDNVPTCGVVAARFKVQSWKELSSVAGELIFFDYPKQEI
ncbi:MAG: phosphohistidine phosphatase SixA [Cyclobacteriaceae bacterium]|nr:MAG: phosphohistidine phosphatase SixA [Cyclobacteriaceae bacterium]